MSETPDWTRAHWRKATRSGGQGGACVEVAPAPGYTMETTPVVGVRDTKDRDGGILVFDRADFEAFLNQQVKGL